MDKHTRFNTVYFFLALFSVITLHNLWMQSRQIETVPYSEFVQLLESGQLQELWIHEEHIRARLKEKSQSGHDFVLANKVEEGLVTKLSQHGLRYSRVIENTFLSDILSWVLPMALFFVIWLYLLRRMSGSGGLGGQMMNIGKSKAKVYVQTDVKVSFDDVAGIDEARGELIEIVNFLKNPQDFGRLGARLPKGILLVGPPGTGKTLLAKAVAGEAQVPFLSISGSEFVEMFVGVGAARVRDLFEQARSKAPCIIFIDELDALGRARSGNQFGGGHDEKEQTLNQLLVELDGFDSSSGIVLLAATNRPEILDPALLRAGRFDRQVLVDRPDRVGRVQILKVHIRKVKIDIEVDLEKVAALTPGFSGADLANLVNEAALAATRRRAETVTLDDFTVAIERIVAGLEKKNRLLNEMERQIIAYHEMGHALVAAHLSGCDRVHKVSIIPRGIGALGYTIQRPTEDRYLMLLDELRNKMTVLLGGRAAEKVKFGHLSTGAADDLAKATDIARSMVSRYGMHPELGNMSYDQDRSMYLQGHEISQRLYSEESAQMIDRAIRQEVDNAMNRSVKILEQFLSTLERSAQLLLEKETLVEEQLKPFFESVAPKSS